MLPPDTGRAMRAIRLLAAATEYGLDPEGLRRRAGIAADQIDDPDKRIPEPNILKLYDLLANQVPDPDLGLELGTRIDIRQAGVLGYAIMNSPTLGSAMRRLARFSRLLSTRFDTELEEGREVWRLVGRQPPPRPGFRPPTDDADSALVTGLRQITGRQIDPVEVCLPYTRPREILRLRSVFRCDLVFEPSRSYLTFRAADMSLPILNAEAKLAEYLDRLAEIELAALPRSDTYARRVGRSAWRQLSEGQPTVADVAREIGVSSRTLQRRLREEGTSFAQVIDDLRRQMAPALLRDENLAVYEIAYLLGYADPSAFFRAFKRWHGRSPADYRDSAPGPSG